MVPQSSLAQTEQTPYSDTVHCTLPALPVPLANNAIAQLQIDGQTHLYSFMGLGAGKSHHDISSAAFSLKVGDPGWSALPDVPGMGGRLASTAVGLNGKIYLFGGYTVAEDGSEVSTPEVYAFDPRTETYETLAEMPTPVDDSVSFAYLDRYIYLVSGWHNVGNVSKIQMFDTQTNTWAEQVEEFPGKAVFGHAGAIVDNVFVIVDGVAVVGIENGRRQFDMWPQAYAGTIDPSDPTAISWRRLPQIERLPTYRAAAIGDTVRGRILFGGGSSRAYNFSGIGYDGIPAEPLSQVFAWNIAADRWETVSDMDMPTMDHRGMIRIDNAFYVIGGMRDGQVISGEISPVADAPLCP